MSTEPIPHLNELLKREAKARIDMEIAAVVCAFIIGAGAASAFWLGVLQCR